MNKLFYAPANYNRNGHLDVLKGFAILLMVLGHAITWLYSPSRIAPPICCSHIWFNVIYSFHMPLLFFVSGYLFPKGEGCTMKQAIISIWRRSVSLLIPWIVGGLLYHLFRNQNISVLWFLMALYNFNVINICWEVIRPVKKYTLVMDVLYYLIVAMLMYKIVPNHIKEALQLQYYQYLFFSIGIIFRRYNLVKFMENRHSYSYMLLFFVVANILPFFDIRIPGAIFITSISAIFCLWYFFKFILTEGSVYEMLKCLGYYSLEIYVTHGFFVIKIFAIGAFIASLTGFMDDMMTRSTIELVVAVTITMVVLTLCMVLIKLAKESYIFNFLFGKTK